MNARTYLLIPLLAWASVVSCRAQMNNGTNAPVDENPKPTWETQKQARTFQLGIPAPRGPGSAGAGVARQARVCARLCRLHWLVGGRGW